MERKKFIADVHLGKLARLLRLLGFDTAYENGYTTEDLIRRSTEEGRILLSRSSSLQAKTLSSHFVFIQSEEPQVQVEQVIQDLGLEKNISAFSRCLVCNGDLRIVSKDVIQQNLLPNTSKYFDEFWQCASCHRIYWKGSHYDRMLKLMERLKATWR